MSSIVSLGLPLSLNLKKSSTQHENGVALLREREKWVWRCRNGRALVEKTLLLLSRTVCGLAICGQEIRRWEVKFRTASLF